MQFIVPSLPEYAVFCSNKDFHYGYGDVAAGLESIVEFLKTICSERAVARYDASLHTT